MGEEKKQVTSLFSELSSLFLKIYDLILFFDAKQNLAYFCSNCVGLLLRKQHQNHIYCPRNNAILSIFLKGEILMLKNKILAACVILKSYFEK